MPSDQRIPKDHPSGTSAWQIPLAIVFGLIFGFLLQKGGVAKYAVLIGVLLLQDFTVLKVMLSAILVGMVGIFLLNRYQRVDLSLKPTRWGANILGGLIFGAGFALAGYCPGTGAAALGQMNWDALFVMGGMILGSYLFAEISAWAARTVEKWGDWGKVLLPDLLKVSRGSFVAGWALLLLIVLFALERFGPR